MRERDRVPRARARLQDFLPEPLGGSPLVKARACVGALLALFAAALAGHLGGLQGGVSLLIAPMGASAVLLFALPASPLAQPWPVVGGNMIAALIGVACARAIPDPALAAPLAVAAAIAAMFALRCLHPPGGAIALSAVTGGPAVQALGYGFALVPVGLASVVLLAGALVFNNVTRHRYPHPRGARSGTHAPAEATPARLGIAAADLDAVLQQYETLDVSRADLEEILVRTQLQAYRRQFGHARCEDIMSGGVVRATRSTGLAEAWALLHRHRVKALPVTEADGRVVGIVTRADFARWSAPSSADGPIDRIMSRPVHTVRTDQPIVDLYPLMAERGHHHIPVVDADARLAGMITQSDLVAAIYRRGLVGLPPAHAAHPADPACDTAAGRSLSA